MTYFTLYVLPMLLGRTYDITNDQTGVDIFPQTELDRAWIIQKYQTVSRYTMVERSTDVRNLLDVSGSLSLKVKSIGLQIEGAGSYLRDTASRSNSIEILIRIHYETITKTLPSSAKPKSNWQNFKHLGTHFCRSITYGGDLIASVIFKAENDEDKEKISGYIKGELQMGGAFDAKVEGKLDKLQEKLKGTASMEINYYATVPVYGIPRTLKGLHDISEQFSNHIKDINGGLGIPLTMELYPLSFLESTFPTLTKSVLLTPYIDQLEMQLDDLTATKLAINDWLTTIPPLQPKMLLQKIYDFKKKIEDILLVFRQTITDLDVSSSGSVDQFQMAFNSYRDDSTSLPDKYLRQFQRLKIKLETEFPEIRPDLGGATYTHWGRSYCNSPGVETVYSGYATKSSKDIMCLPSDAELEIVTERTDAPSLFSTDIKCSFCHVTNRTSTLIQSGMKNCPNNWEKEYEGILSGSESYICLDINSEQKTRKFFDAVYGSDQYNNDVTLSCVVCSK